MSGRRADVPALTGVRAFAALWVVSYHLWIATGRVAVSAPRVDPLFEAGWLGVDVFFVLSGFVLQWQVEHERDASMRPWLGARAYGRFLGRRVLRVFPAYLACLTILLPLAWLGVGRWTAPAFGDTALHLVMSHNVVPTYVSSISGVFWSLPVEFHFYLAFPLGAWLLSGGRVWPLVVVALALTAFVHWLAIHPAFDWVLAWTPFRTIEFAAGMSAAALAARSRGLTPAAADVLFVAAFASLLAIAWHSATNDLVWWTNDAIAYVRMIGISLAIAAMLYAMTAPGASRVGTALFGNRAVVWAGMISYSLYLWHFSIIEFVVDHRLVPFRVDGTSHDFFALAAIAVPATFAVSALSYYAVERVFLDRARWRTADDDGVRWMRRPIRIAIAWALAILAVAGIVAIARSGG